MQPPRPFVLGAEFAGTVATAPPGSTYKPGDRVFGYAQGAYGERVVVESAHVLPLPDVLSFDQGAGACCLCLVSHARLVGCLWCTAWRTVVIMSDLYPYLCRIGLYLTYPTSYEALVGRGKLRAGTQTHDPAAILDLLLSYVIFTTQASGFSFWPQQEAWA